MRQRMAQSKYVSTRETTNLARIVRIILGPCTDILCAVLTKEIQPCTLVQNVKTFIAKQKKPPITQKQQLLVNAGNYSDFDISLLYFLLRNVCSIPPHVQQWGKDPLYQDRGLSANIERIRIVRKKNYGHVTQFSLSDADFEQQWKTIFQIVRDLESYLGTDTEYQNALTELKTCCMDPEAEETFLKKLQGNSLDLNGNSHKICVKWLAVYYAIYFYTLLQKISFIFVGVNITVKITYMIRQHRFQNCPGKS